MNWISINGDPVFVNHIVNITPHCTRDVDGKDVEWASINLSNGAWYTVKMTATEALIKIITGGSIDA